MKNVIVKFLFLVAMGITSATFAGQTSGYAPGEWYLAFGGGLAAGTAQPSATLGGGNGTIGFMLDKTHALQLQTDILIDNEPTNSIYRYIYNAYFRFVPELKVLAEGSGFVPYGLGGIGVEYYSLSYDSVGKATSFTYPDIVLGGGVQYELLPRLNFYAEAKYNLAIVTGGTASDIGLQGGFSFGL